MYLLRIDHRVYTGHGDGRPFTLADALAEALGVGNAAVLRSDGTEVISNAGSAYAVTHTPTGRRVTRRRARHLRYSPACRQASGGHSGCDGWTYGAHSIGMCQCTCGCSARRAPGSAAAAFCR